MEDPLAQAWDDSLRKLVHANPQAFVHLVDPEAEYLHAIKEKLKPLTREVDGLLLTQRKDGKQQLIHIEMQSTNDPTMGDRMVLYHVLARTQYNLPVLSSVIYLRQDGNVPQPPHQWEAADGRVTNEFHYLVIEVVDMTAEELRAFGEIGLLPLLPLTRDGATRQAVEEMFTKLQVAGTLDLLQIGQLIASLAFGDRRPADQEWVLRRYREMYDRLQETPVYKEMTRLASEKARQEGIQEGQLRASRELLLSIVQARFPKLFGLTKRLASTIDQTSVLQTLILNISRASNLKEARQYLLDVSQEDTNA
jgi:predicted transposase YdaD